MDIYEYLRDAITPEIKSLQEGLEDFKRETDSLAALVESQRKEASKRAVSIDNKIVASMAKTMNEKLAGLADWPKDVGIDDRDANVLRRIFVES